MRSTMFPWLSDLKRSVTTSLAPGPVRSTLRLKKPRVSCPAARPSNSGPSKKNVISAVGMSSTAPWVVRRGLLTNQAPEVFVPGVMNSAVEKRSSPEQVIPHGRPKVPDATQASHGRGAALVP